MKRLLKPILVILAILILTLSVSAGDLFSTYGKRIKVTIDHTKIDSDLSWFPVTVFLGNYGDAIDIGVAAIHRPYVYYTATLINKDNPANASGTITSVEIYAYKNMSGATVATFYRPDPTGQPNYLVARDSYEIGSVTSGSKQTFEVDLDVEAGDYLGIYFSAGSIERDASGGGGVWLKYGGDYTETAGATFSMGNSYVFSLYATGFEKSQGTEVFTEFDADEDFDRIAFTTSDEETQLYADCELFDVSENKAIYHVSKTGWTVSSSADTDIYLYYDNTADHNTTYISKSGGTAAQSVWDSNFKAVYHMQDNTTSTIVDSTSNNNDGTKKGANEPIEATGKVGQGQDFDGTDDYIEIANDASLNISPEITIEAIIKTNSITGRQRIVNKYSTTNVSYSYQINNKKFTLEFMDTDDNWHSGYSTTSLSGETIYLISTSYDGRYFKNYIDGSEDNTVDLENNYDIKSTTVPVDIGRYTGTNVQHFDGIIDETRISSTNRSAAWISATYSTLWDTLLSYGSEETGGTAEEATNVLFIFSNF